MFSGSIVALITPFRNGQIDVEAVKNIVQWHLQEGTNGLVVCGSTGEAALLTQTERRQLITLVVEQAQGKIPVIVGCGSPSTREAIQMTHEAKELGANGALVVTPYYVKPTAEGMYQHYLALNQIGLPIILYSNPGRAGVTLPVEVVVRLSELDHIVGIKDSCDDLTRLVKMRSQIKKKFVYLSGDDPLSTAYLAQGGDGFISVSANVLPGKCVQLMKAWRDKNYDVFAQLRDELLPFHEIMFVETSPSPVKYAASVLGFCSEEVRLPLLTLAESSKKQILQVMLQLGIEPAQNAA